MLAATDWNEWVAIGTLALAAMTVFVGAVGVATALFTKKLADETTALAEITRASVAIGQAELAGQIRPLIVDIASLHDVQLRQHASLNRRDPASGIAGASFVFRNLGPGTAILRDDPGPTIGPSLHGPRFNMTHPRTIIATGETVYLFFNFGGDIADQYIDVPYTDVAGQQPRRSVFFFRSVIEHGLPALELNGFAIFDGDNETPTVVSGDGDW